MVDVALTALLAPALVCAAMLAGNRWGARAGGVLSAFPAIVGPVLVIDLLMHDEAFVARAATGTLLGLVALSAFVAVYGRLAGRTGWRGTVLGAWAAAAVTGAPLAAADVSLLVALAAAVASLVAAALVLPRSIGPPPPTEPASGRAIAATAGACGVLVLALAGAAGLLGATAGGVLAALPVLASVLAVSTHRRRGAQETVLLLGGMVSGMAGFVAFCLSVALLVEQVAPLTAFGIATAAALAAQLASQARGRRRAVDPTAPPLIQATGRAEASG